jgi:hypothetical protein
MDIVEGMIVGAVVYYDYASMLTQLGVEPSS